jgi:hypothetical protein
MVVNEPANARLDSDGHAGMAQVRASSETSRSTASSPGAPYHQA